MVSQIQPRCFTPMTPKSQNEQKGVDFGLFQIQNPLNPLNPHEFQRSEEKVFLIEVGKKHAGYGGSGGE